MSFLDLQDARLRDDVMLTIEDVFRQYSGYVGPVQDNWVQEFFDRAAGEVIKTLVSVAEWQSFSDDGGERNEVQEGGVVEGSGGG